MATEISSTLIDGKLVAKQIREEVASEVARIKALSGIVPGLAVILVGARKDSQTYVRNKKKACEEVGIASFEACLPEDCTEEEVIEHISKFNSNPLVHGILVQLPLPRHLNEEKILNTVSIEKDVDGFHPLNIGRLAMQGREPLFVPCTQKEITRQADILISAAGAPNLVKGSWIKPGAVVIDVGINAVDDKSSARGYRLVGDVCFEEASRVASAITPVPGGVGPMTIAMLLSNTLSSAKRTHDLHFS
ncbi:hypothetical protein HPP92_024501 [Vanilla planifolia]|nr:hypothetical protein HPP92_024501 [Vanilla planifolia]